MSNFTRITLTSCALVCLFGCEADDSVSDDSSLSRAKSDEQTAQAPPATGPLGPATAPTSTYPTTWPVPWVPGYNDSGAISPALAQALQEKANDDCEQHCTTADDFYKNWCAPNTGEFDFDSFYREYSAAANRQDPVARGADKKYCKMAAGRAKYLNDRSKMLHDYLAYCVGVHGSVLEGEVINRYLDAQQLAPGASAAQTDGQRYLQFMNR